MNSITPNSSNETVAMKQQQQNADSGANIAKPTAQESPRKKSQCPVAGCTARPSLAVGKCKYCELTYCSSHRLVELHKCEKGIEGTKQDHKQRLEDRLLAERTGPKKVL